jgi:mono/diheme cytochrome c family protein
MNMTVRSTCLAALLALTACGSAGGTDAGSTRTDTLGALTGDATAGKTVFDANCASCHKVDGTGTPPNFPALASSAKTWTKPQFFTILLEGKGLMASYKTLSDQQLANVVEYVRTTFNK